MRAPDVAHDSIKKTHFKTSFTIFDRLIESAAATDNVNYYNTNIIQLLSNNDK